MRSCLDQCHNLDIKNIVFGMGKDEIILVVWVFECYLTYELISTFNSEILATVLNHHLVYET